MAEILYFLMNLTGCVFFAFAIVFLLIVLFAIIRVAVRAIKEDQDDE